MIRDIVTSFTDSKLVNEIDRKELSADFTVTQHYINNSNEAVYVTLRNNLVTKVTPLRGVVHPNGTFCIRTVYNFNSQAKIIETIDLIAKYKAMYKITNVDHEIIAQTLLNSYTADRQVRHCTITMEKEIDIKTIDKIKTIYVNDVDILLTTESATMKTLHPHSAEHINTADKASYIAEHKVNGIFVELVDNENNVKNRYIYVAGQLLDIPAIRDDNRKSGVYFTTATYTEEHGAQINPQYFTYDAAETEIGLYKTKEEAETAGNVESIIKERELALKNDFISLQKDDNAKRIEISNLKSESDKMKISLENAKTENEILKARLESKRMEHEISTVDKKHGLTNSELEIEKLKKINARIKEKYEKKKTKRSDKFESKKMQRSDYYEGRHLVRDDYYEDRSHVRKDNSELVKYIPALAVAAAGVFAWTQRKP